MRGAAGLRVDAIVFDVGETLVDETRAWTEHAHEVGVTPLTLCAALGALIERGGSHHAVWDLLGVRPPARRVEIGPEDLYPDAVPCLRAFADRGCVLGLAGNQSAETEAELSRLGMPVAFIASSARWGVAKPSSAFFDRVMAEVELPADRIAYVGDRLDNDVLPARVAGLVSVFLRRGPWGLLHAGRPEAALADVTVDSLLELPDRLTPPRPPG
jgi:FMN phosphatase YigB (HAD superfamily)